MAGIGFELKKILSKETLLSTLSAYFYAGMVSSGPWLISIICLGFLGIYRGSGLGAIEHEIFRSTVVYSYAFSLVLVGIIQLATTRYLADLFYDHDVSKILSTLFTCLLLLFVAGAVFAGSGYVFFELSLFHKLCGVVLFLVISAVWICIIFLSAIKDYKSIIFAFASGSLVSVLAAIQLGGLMGTEGYLLGYLLGQALVMFWLIAKMLVEFPAVGLWNRELILFYRKFWDLMLIGFIFNLAIWVDKFIFWMAPDARVIVPHFRTHDLYEGPIFFSCITIIPTLALFLLKIETGFALHYQRYYGKIVGKMSLKSILAEKELLIGSIKESMREVFIIQGFVTTLCLFFTPQLTVVAKLIPLQIPIFRVALVGSFLQALLSVNIIILFYFDLRKCVLAVSALFLAANSIFSLITIRMGVQYYGYGFTYACLISLLLAFFLLNAKVRDLEYVTFAGQPVK